VTYRLMYDSDQLAALRPLHADGNLVATYADLVTPQVEREFGGALAVIDRGHGDPLRLATIGDFETGLLDPASAGHWWDTHQGRGDLTVYANRSTMPAVLRALGPQRPAWRWWATLDGTMHAPGNPAAMVQFAGAAMTGRHADATIIYHPNWKPSRGTP
jgi:hypothetical protein